VHENLHVISSGPVPPNPSEMLMGTTMDQLIAKLKLEYDDIIIDTAPIGLVADAQIISRFANATIFIIRHGYSLKSQVHNIEHLYREKKLPGMSIVFNGVNMGGRYGYGYGAGYGYGKDYGYYEDNDVVKEKFFRRMWNLLRRV
jgi:tyrosine-protein kinase Etk/Wzc